MGTVLDFYSESKDYMAYGFGGKKRGIPTAQIEHCFSLNMDDNSTVHGHEGILQAYRESLYIYGLYGPTYFKEFLANFLKQCKLKRTSMVYHVLLILTDGQYHDQDATKDLIVELSAYPVSIIIVGLGDDDFSGMEELDGDDVMVRNKKGEPWKRDIVQFVKFNDF